MHSGRNAAGLELNGDFDGFLAGRHLRFSEGFVERVVVSQPIMQFLDCPRIQSRSDRARVSVGPSLGAEQCVDVVPDLVKTQRC